MTVIVYLDNSLMLQESCKMNSNLKAIDLFCGAGGLTVGLKQAGFNVLAGIEIDIAAADTYKLNHKGHKLYHADIKKLIHM